MARGEIEARVGRAQEQQAANRTDRASILCEQLRLWCQVVDRAHSPRDRVVVLVVSLGRAGGDVQHRAVELKVVAPDAAAAQPVGCQVERVLSERCERFNVGGAVLARGEVGRYVGWECPTIWAERIDRGRVAEPAHCEEVGPAELSPYREP